MFDFLVVLFVIIAVFFFLVGLGRIGFHLGQLVRAITLHTGEMRRMNIELQVITSAINEVSLSIDQASTPTPLVILPKGNGSNSGARN